MKRQMWLKNSITGSIWDLMPDNPYYTEGGCALLSPQGLGYQQIITQEQVEVDYFISGIQSKNKAVTGVLYFNGDEHLEKFQAFVGDFRRQFLLYYSPSAEYEPYDQISSPYYKAVTISQVDKTEKDEFGWYACSVIFSTQSDVWNRDVYLYIDGARQMQGEPLVYPYIYPYSIGGRNVYAIDIPNKGREIGCIVKIKNNTDIPLSQIEWFIDNTIISDDGQEIITTQRAKWYTSNTNILLHKDYELYVDSNPTTQEAKVNYPNGISQSVVAQQEPSWDYINFVRIKHGENRIVFYIDSENVDISVIYREQKEII